MKSQDNPAKTENKPDHMNTENPSKSEPMTQVQKDNVINSKDLPDRQFSFGFPLLILAIFLFVAAIYYGIINP
ncbi:hypothetical protein [Calothrix sp. NIES-2098]|uniref:hypothetical protein n=1 Tax=Calothrix sp. NIES-2098 TaxID=1954171 RepID=UPI000B61A9B1|nr:hypothetical protein NIES2098_57670 [Calothrix sp. NIES-2098]